MTYASRVSQLKAEGAYQVLARAQALEASGRDIIHLEIGEPDFDTAANIRMAGVHAIAAGHTRYNPPQGLGQLREVIAEAAGEWRGMQFHPDQVVVSPGAKPNLFFPTLALVDSGDQVIYPDPGFPTYEAMIRVAGGVPVPVPLLEEKGFSYDLQAFGKLVNERTKLILLNSPSNPTGGVMSWEDLEQIAKTAQRYDCWVLSDEIYARIAYDGLKVPCIASLPGMANRTVIVDGFSKTYAMTGWRLGFGIMPAELADRVQLLLTHSIGCTAHFTQYAGIEALMGPQGWVDEMIAAYERRRNVLVDGLNAIVGVSCQTPRGAFYTFPNVQALGKPSNELANLLLEEAGVAVLPGTAFGVHGEGYLRIAYANSMENIERALERMQPVLNAVARGGSSPPPSSPLPSTSDEPPVDTPR